MLQMIINWLVSAIVGALEKFIQIFFGTFLTMDLKDFLNAFPILGSAYTIFRGIGFGLVAVYAVIGLVKFFVPGLLGGKESTDTPIGILFKTMIAAGMVNSGNYLLEYIIEIAKVPFNAFNDLAIKAGDGKLGEILASIGPPDVVTLVGVGGILFLELILFLMLAWNIFKLAIEVCERYLMVGVMVFTSPPFFAMIATNDTLNQFVSWLKMFIGACTMMAVSVFFTKVVVSGLVAIPTNAAATTAFGQISGLEPVFRTIVLLLFVLAMSKIAQHADEYLNQLGLGVPKTGGSLLDDIMVSGITKNFLGGGGGKHGGGSSSVLGRAATSTFKGPLSFGAAGALYRNTAPRIAAWRNAYAQGKSAKEAWEAFKGAKHDTASAPMAARAAASHMKNVDANVAGAMANGAKGQQAKNADANVAGAMASEAKGQQPQNTGAVGVTANGSQDGKTAQPEKGLNGQSQTPNGQNPKGPEPIEHGQNGPQDGQKNLSAAGHADGDGVVVAGAMEAKQGQPQPAGLDGDNGINVQPNGAQKAQDKDVNGNIVPAPAANEQHAESGEQPAENKTWLDNFNKLGEASSGLAVKAMSWISPQAAAQREQNIAENARIEAANAYNAQTETMTKQFNDNARATFDSASRNASALYDSIDNVQSNQEAAAKYAEKYGESDIKPAMTANDYKNIEKAKAQPEFVTSSFEAKSSNIPAGVQHFEVGASGNAVLNAEARAAGIGYNDDKNIISGDNSRVAAFIRANASGAVGASDEYARVAQDFAASQKGIEDATQTATEAMVNTVKSGNGAIAKDVLMAPEEIGGNDAVYSAAIEKVLPKLAAQTEAGFYNVRGTNEEGKTHDVDGQEFQSVGGRSITASYSGIDGNTHDVQIYDATAYTQHQVSGEDMSGFRRRGELYYKDTIAENAPAAPTREQYDARVQEAVDIEAFNAVPANRAVMERFHLSKPQDVRFEETGDGSRTVAVAQNDSGGWSRIETVDKSYYDALDSADRSGYQIVPQESKSAPITYAKVEEFAGYQTDAGPVAPRESAYYAERENFADRYNLDDIKDMQAATEKMSGRVEENVAQRFSDLNKNIEQQFEQMKNERAEGFRDIFSGTEQKTDRRGNRVVVEESAQPQRPRPSTPTMPKETQGVRPPKKRSKR